MEMQMDSQQQFIGPQLAGTSSSSVREEEEHKRNKENIPPFSSYSSGSGSVLRLPHPRKPLQDITHNIRCSPSVAEARARLRLGVRSSSNKCCKKKAGAHVSSVSVGVALSEKRCQRHEMAVLRKSFR